MLAGAANLRSCFLRPVEDTGLRIHVSASDPSDPNHRVLAAALLKMWIPQGRRTDGPRSPSPSPVNAVSFGGARFLFWVGASRLPTWEIDGIAAHEVAHDRLEHSRKAVELQDVTSFFGEVLGLLGGANSSGQEVLSEWVDLAAFPRYSRQQELQADAKAVEILRAAGYGFPQQTYSDTLRLLLEKYGNAGGGRFDSHPATTERIARLAQQ